MKFRIRFLVALLVCLAISAVSIGSALAADLPIPNFFSCYVVANGTFTLTVTNAGGAGYVGYDYDGVNGSFKNLGRLAADETKAFPGQTIPAGKDYVTVRKFVSADGTSWHLDGGTHSFDRNASPRCNALPGCSGAYPSVASIWPANHEFVQVSILGVKDANGNPAALTITSIYQDEPVNSSGDGASAPDARGVGTARAEVRAERNGAGNGRVYHIRFTAADGKGGACTGEVQVRIPKSSGKYGAAVDGGALYNSTLVP